MSAFNLHVSGMKYKCGPLELEPAMIEYFLHIMWRTAKWYSCMVLQMMFSIYFTLPIVSIWFKKPRVTLLWLCCIRQLSATPWLLDNSLVYKNPKEHSNLLVLCPDWAWEWLNQADCLSESGNLTLRWNCEQCWWMWYSWQVKVPGFDLTTLINILMVFVIFLKQRSPFVFKDCHRA